MLQTASETDHQPFRFAGVGEFPGLAQRFAHAGMKGFRQPLDDDARQGHELIKGIPFLSEA